jgi:hypothetical protein
MKRPSRVRYWPAILREKVQASASYGYVFLFGDNLQRRGNGGQALHMRGEPNAIGVPTKRAPSMHESAFFSDDDFDANCTAIDAAFALIPADVTLIVIPSGGLGTGRAQLQQRAPRTWAHLQACLRRLEES